MQDDANGIRAGIKKKLADLLQATAGGVVVAAATLATPAVEASTSVAKPNTALENRVNELRKQAALPSTVEGDNSQSFVAFNNWGNHWNNWNNGWHNWHNWHNF
jgi:hypothetical protein